MTCRLKTTLAGANIVKSYLSPENQLAVLDLILGASSGFKTFVQKAAGPLHQIIWETGRLAPAECRKLLSGHKDLLQVAEHQKQNVLVIILALHILAWDVVEEIPFVKTNIPTGFAVEDNRLLQEAERRQPRLAPSHPHPEIFVNVFVVFFLDGFL